MNHSVDHGYNKTPIKISLPPIAQTSFNSLNHSPDNSPRRNHNLSVQFDSPPKMAMPIQNKKSLNISMEANSRYKVSVQDVINSSKKITDDWGVSGYTIPKFNAHFDKPITFKISKENPQDFISQEIKRRAFVPGPGYDTRGSMILTKKLSISKLPRITNINDIMKAAEKTPSPGQYNTFKKSNPLGIFKQKSDRIGFLDEAGYLGSVTPSHYDSSRLEAIKPRTSVVKIQPNGKDRFPKFEKNDDPSPLSYDIENSFKKTKLSNISFKIGKQKDMNFVDRHIKNKAYVPSVGTYELSNVDKFISKGGKSYR
eukprot:403371309